MLLNHFCQGTGLGGSKPCKECQHISPKQRPGILASSQQLLPDISFLFSKHFQYNITDSEKPEREAPINNCFLDSVAGCNSGVS